VTSSQVSALGIPYPALVSVALSSLLEGLVTSWLREDASASSVSLDDVILDCLNPVTAIRGARFFLTLWVWTPLEWFPQHCQQKIQSKSRSCVALGNSRNDCRYCMMPSSYSFKVWKQELPQLPHPIFAVYHVEHELCATYSGNLDQRAFW
jgi:hypothetical protein